MIVDHSFSSRSEEIAVDGKCGFRISFGTTRRPPSSPSADPSAFSGPLKSIASYSAQRTPFPQGGSKLASAEREDIHQHGDIASPASNSFNSFSTSVLDTFFHEMVLSSPFPRGEKSPCSIGVVQVEHASPGVASGSASRRVARVALNLGGTELVALHHQRLVTMGTGSSKNRKVCQGWHFGAGHRA